MFLPRCRQGALLRDLCPDDRLPRAAAAHGNGLQDDGDGESGFDPREDLQGTRAWVGGPKYTAIMTDIYN